MPSQMLGIPEFVSQLRVRAKADAMPSKDRNERLNMENDERRILKAREKSKIGMGG